MDVCQTCCPSRDGSAAAIMRSRRLSFLKPGETPSQPVHSVVSTGSNRTPAPEASEGPVPPTRLGDRGRDAALHQPGDSPATRAGQGPRGPSDGQTPEICAEYRRVSFLVADTLPVRSCHGRTGPKPVARYGRPRGSGYSPPRPATDRISTC